MKCIVSFALIVLSVGVLAQSPCQDGTIIINGSAIDAVFIENENKTGLNLPLWLSTGTTLATGTRVLFISVIEFNVTTEGGNSNLSFNRVLQVGAQTETVPADKVWKVEAIVKHANAFSSGFTASSNSPVCQNQSLNLSATSVDGATYQWTGPNGFTSTAQNPVIGSVPVAASGTYSMTATLNGCTSAPTSTTVVVNPLPVSSFTQDPPLAISNTNLTLLPNEVGASYSWQFNSGNPATSSAANPVVQWTGAGNYDVILTVTDGNGCVSTSTQVVSVSDCPPGQPSSAFTPAAASVNIPKTFVPAASGADSYSWTFQGGNPSSSSSPSPSVTWSSPGSYNVSLTVTSGGCFTTTTNTVVVSDPVTVTYAFTGSAQSFTVPNGVTSVTIECWGARGGNSSSTAGKGGYAKGDLAVNPGEVLHVFVGGSGSDVSNSQVGGGGYNGGGHGNGSSGGGGGASDVRYVGTALANRVIVAAGGGGAGLVTPGGDGGGLTGSNGMNGTVGNPGGGGAGASQSAGGNGGSPGSGSPGALGQGGQGGNVSGIGYSGGGGGGYYGGGGGGGEISWGNGGGGGGGGGSSYIGGVTNGETTAGVWNDNGQVKITY